MSAWYGSISDICYTVLTFTIHGPTELWNVLPRSPTPSILMGKNQVLSNRVVGWGKVTVVTLSFPPLCWGTISLHELVIPSGYAELIKQILHQYVEAGGQTINLNKSSMVFSKNMPRDIRMGISTILQIPNMNGQDKFLGLPSVIPA